MSTEDALLEQVSNNLCGSVPCDDDCVGHTDVEMRLCRRLCATAFRSIGIPLPVLAWIATNLGTSAALAAGTMEATSKTALDWLRGLGPDDKGLWFGDDWEGQPPGRFWWRTTFTRLCEASLVTAAVSPPTSDEGLGGKP